MNSGPPQIIEGERFLDEDEKPIPPRNTWDELTTNQLIDVKLLLEQQLWAFSRNALIAKTISEGIAHITLLISLRSS